MDGDGGVRERDWAHERISTQTLRKALLRAHALPEIRRSGAILQGLTPCVIGVHLPQDFPAPQRTWNRSSWPRRTVIRPDF